MQRKISLFSGACAAGLALMPLGFTALPASAQDGGTDGRDALYNGGLANLQALSRYFTPQQRDRIPTLRAILHRVIYDTDQANDDELAIASTLVTGDPLSNTGGRGAGSMSQAILALQFKPLVAAHVSPVQAAAVVKPVANTINKSYVKIAGVSKSVTYSSGVIRKPGGGSSGYVDMTKGSKRTRIVEIPTAASDLGVSARAKTIARRMTSVQQRDPVWWTRITAGQAADGESVVSLPNGPVPYILTADTSFAKEWNMAPAGLAQSLVTKIRGAIETSGARGVLTTREEEAVSEKQAGDEAYAKGDKASAERHYKQAIKDNPVYVAAYKLLISLYKEQNRTEDATALSQAAGGEALTGDQIAEIERAAQ